jgi:hypothetical protein
MTNDQLILYAFAMNCPRLVKAVQDDALILIDVTGNKVTYMMSRHYLPTDDSYIKFLFDMDDSDITYQMAMLNHEYFLRIYT